MARIKRVSQPDLQDKVDRVNNTARGLTTMSRVSTKFSKRGSLVSSSRASPGKTTIKTPSF